MSPFRGLRLQLCYYAELPRHTHFSYSVKLSDTSFLARQILLCIFSMKTKFPAGNLLSVAGMGESGGLGRVDRHRCFGKRRQRLDVEAAITRKWRYYNISCRFTIASDNVMKCLGDSRLATGFEVRMMVGLAPRLPVTET